MTVKPPRIRLRPHHFLCIIGFRNKGYSPEFVDHFAELVKTLKSDPSTLLEVTRKSDFICEPCPHRQGDGCETQEVIDPLDEGHQKALGWIVGEQLTWTEALERLRTRATLERFHEMCAPCSWKKLGFCEEALQQLIEK
jgi:hypothetical protein